VSNHRLLTLFGRRRPGLLAQIAALAPAGSYWWHGEDATLAAWPDRLQGVNAAPAGSGTSIGSLNGRACPVFDGSGNYGVGLLPWNTWSTASAIVAFATGASIPDYQALVGVSGGGASWVAGPCGNATFRNGWGGNGALALGSPSAAYATSAAYVGAWTKTATAWTISRDGVAGSPIADAVWPSAAPNVYIGSNTVTYRYTGSIASVLIMPGDGAAAAAIARLLGAYYGIAVA
jgi:hypothetical protein